MRPRVTRLIEVTTELATVGASAPEAFLADATEYLEATGHIVLSWDDDADDYLVNKPTSA